MRLFLEQVYMLILYLGVPIIVYGLRIVWVQSVILNMSIIVKIFIICNQGFPI